MKTNNYQPSASNARTTLGVKLTEQGYPAGPQGAALSLNEVARRVREGRNDPLVRGWAGRVLIAAGKPKSNIDQAQAILNAVRKQTMYAQDPVGTEMNVAARYTLCLDDKLCMPLADCDDLCVATASAMMSVGIPTQIVGQSFAGKTDAPTHVLLAIESPSGWKKVDPSSPTMRVGEFFPGTKEWWVDPMEVNGFSLSATADAKDGENGGDFVGVGSPGLGDIDRGAVYDAVTSQLQDALFTLESAVNGLGASLVKIQQTRAQLQPGQPFDAEPFTISSIADFPNNGLWTESMQYVSVQLWQVGNTLVQAGHDALNGIRDIIVDQNTNEAYVASDPSDEWSIKLLAQKATDSIFGFLNKAGQIISGISAKTGQDYTPTQVQTEVTSLNQVGVANPVVIVAAVAAVAAIASVAAYYMFAKHCDTARTIADNAVRKSVIDCIASGRCTQDQGVSLLHAVADDRKAAADAEEKTNASDPLSRLLGSIGTIVTWTVIGGVAFAGLYVTMPLLKELGANAAAAYKSKRLAT